MSVGKLLIGGLISLLLGGAYVASNDQPAQPSVTESTVQKVIDGDTVDISGSDPTRNRLIGIDTPEVYGGKECYGPEASTKLKELLPVGTKVRLVEDTGKHDRYGRRLTYIYRESDNLFVNAEMIKTGHARAYPYGKDLAHKDELASLEAEAQTAGRGLWGSCK